MKSNSFRPPQKPKNNRKGFRIFGFIALLILFSLVILATYNQPNTVKEIPFSQVISQANDGKFSRIVVSGNGNELKITEKGKDDPTLKSFKDPSVSLKDEGLKESKVTVEYEKAAQNSLWSGLLLSLLPVLLIGALLVFMMRSVCIT